MSCLSFVSYHMIYKVASLRLLVDSSSTACWKYDICDSYLDSNHRSKKTIFSTVQAEEMVEILICLLLDRRLERCLALLNECLQAIIHHFAECW